jgi:hypothetical protein
MGEARTEQGSGSRRTETSSDIARFVNRFSYKNKGEIYTPQPAHRPKTDTAAQLASRPIILLTASKKKKKESP